jgi:hypothetical protein
MKMAHDPPKGERFDISRRFAVPDRSRIRRRIAVSLTLNEASSRRSDPPEAARDAS